MRIGRKAKLSGGEYLLVMAANAADREQPHAWRFRRMVSANLVEPVTPMYLDHVATRPLHPHEASPMSIIVTAVRAALDNGDREAALEALNLGVALLAKWPDYLVAADAHPSLQQRSEAQSS